MIIVEAIRSTTPPAGKQPDHFEIEWYETSKSIIRRKTNGGLEMAIRKNSNKPLEDGDILWEDETTYVQVMIRPCECIVFQPKTMRDMGIICFEIGNKHIPIYIDAQDTVNVAYETPLYTLLERGGYEPRVESKKLLKTHLFQIHGR
ncbi:urease accessory protein UreE [Pseudoflavitalea sp. G-6-1-2]|uniref:urease accessory protein UreE n=1 Tax=Pseudoflavitalea sp. G-6-1-2 TaxID=2728841 RepID=UPI0019805A8B|nr:urease accessory protein UreE [Pseudoflavitalea sp. G-6-1-2]